MKLFSGSSVVMRHCSAWPLSRISSCARHAALRRADARAVGDADLRLDEIDAGDAFGDGVLDLDARIDLDEVELAGVGVLQEFDGAGGEIVRGAADLRAPPRRAPRAARRSEKARRRALDDLLVAALHGAIALEQMHERCHGVSPRICTSTWRARSTSFSR